MKTRIEVSPKILDWVLENIKRDSVSKQALECLKLWKSGEKTPTFSQIQKVSRATRIPFGYFFLETPPKEDLPLLKYNTVKNAEFEKPSRELVDVIYDMENVQDWLRGFLISQGQGPLKFVGSLKNEKDIGAFASRVRELLSISENWREQTRSARAFFNFVRKAISGLGTPVMTSRIVGNNNRRRLDIREFRSFALCDPYAPLIFINSNDLASRKLFSLLHEFCYLCLGRHSLFNQPYETDQRLGEDEKLCRAVVSEILVPQTEFVKAWNSCQNDPEKIIDMLAKHFKCEITLAAKKAWDNGFIGNDLYWKTVRLAEQNKKKQTGGKGGGNCRETVESRLDPRFLKLLVSSVREGKTLYTEAFRLTNTNYSSFMKLERRVYGDPR